MTTHDGLSQATDTVRAARTPDTPMDPADERTSPETRADATIPADAAPASDAASAVAVDRQQQSAPAATAPDSSTAPGRPAPGDAEAPVSAQHSVVEPESSTGAALFADDELADLRGRWTSVQAAFVDSPQDCVQRADELVSNVVDQLTAGFADARSRLEEQWARGEKVSTEDLRVALTHYREFFERLLAV